MRDLNFFKNENSGKLVNPKILQTSWIENLALEELNTEESGIINFEEHLNPEFYLEESSIRFVDELKELFEVYVQKFNEFRGDLNSNSLVKIFKISNTVNDFMLFRNSLKLIVARKANDLVSVGFMSNTGGMYSARVSGTNSFQASNLTNHEIKAHVGPFQEITWRFNGEIVSKDAIVRHYLTEFLKHSCR